MRIHQPVPTDCAAPAAPANASADTVLSLLLWYEYTTNVT